MVMKSERTIIKANDGFFVAGYLEADETSPHKFALKQKFLGSPTNASVFCGPFRRKRMQPMGRYRKVSE